MIRNWLSFVLVSSLGSLSISLIPSKLLAQTQLPIQACQTMGIGKYTVLVSQVRSTTLQMPNYLAASATPCSYLGQTTIFFGNFNTIDRALFRVTQLRQASLNAIVQSFTDSNNREIPAGFIGAAVIVEPQANPSQTLQQVGSLTATPAQFAIFNNRSVILASPLINVSTANNLVTTLRRNGFKAEYVDPRFVQVSEAPAAYVVPVSTNSSTPTNSLFRVLIPQSNEYTLGQVRNSYPAAFLRNFQGRNYIQTNSYSNAILANQVRDRLVSQFPGTIVVFE